MPDRTGFGSSLPKHFHKPWPATSEVFGSSFSKAKAQLAQRMRRVLLCFRLSLCSICSIRVIRTAVAVFKTSTEACSDQAAQEDFVGEASLTEVILPDAKTAEDRSSAALNSLSLVLS